MIEKDPKKVAAAEARAARLSGERKTEIAQSGALARWGYKALHRGNFEQELGIDVDCYVLGDVGRTPVISQSGMARALGLSPRGNAFPRFINSRAMAEVVGADLRGNFENPLKFQWGTGGAEQPPATIHGFDAGLLIDLCRAIIVADAKGAVPARYSKIVQQANIINGASAKNGIRQFVYALAGYSPTAEEVITAFKAYVQEEARKYEPEFPNELYAEWYRLYELPVITGRGRPWQFKYLTVNHIYYPLAKSSGKLLTLLRATKARNGDRAKKLFQFLNMIGTRALRMHLGRVLEMAESSKSRHEYEQKITARFGGQHEMELIIPAAAPAPPPETPAAT
jgi:hypothetical protein